MSPMFRSDPFAGTHGRARELAASRIDGPLAAADDAWLEAHLAECDECFEIAAAYDDQRGLLRALRDTQPEPPRDLWARTAATIEAEGPGAGRSRDTRGPGRGWWPGSLPLAPMAAVMVVAIVVGASLLNGVSLFPPGESGSQGGGSTAPTPIPLTAGQVEVLTRGADGSLELTTKQIDEVCPVGAETCGTSGETDSTTIDNVADLGDFDAVISPTKDHIVLMQRDGKSSGVFVVPVGEPTVPSTPAPVTPSPAATPAASMPTPAPVDVTPSPVATDSPGPAESPAGTPEATPEVTPEPSPRPTEPPTPSPSVAVTAAPDGAIEIARDVILVGNVSSYSPDGTRFAFTARPADGSAGPDVYLWRTDEREAHRVTTDHASVFADWAGDRMLVSRVVDEAPVTTLLDPVTGDEEALPDPAIWRPTVGPDGRTAVWWEGTIAANDDGLTWRPGTGRLVLGAWPHEGGTPQVLDKGKIRDWDVRWDEAGDVVALWTSREDPGQPGRLSLYAVDEETGALNVDKPLLEDMPAFGGFSLRSGRLAWSAPAEGGDTIVNVLAWSGDKRGRLQLTTESGGTVVR